MDKMIKIIIDKTKATPQEVAALESLPEYQALIGTIKISGRLLGVSLGITDQNASFLGWPEGMRRFDIEECPEIPAIQK